MQISPARGADTAALDELYHRNHRQTPRRLKVEPDQHARTLVATADDRILGFAIVSCFDDGVHRYGILHVLEVDNPQADFASGTVNALVAACRHWLDQCGTDVLLAAPQLNSWLIMEGLRALRRLQVIDPQRFARSSDPPAPVRVARRTL